MIQLPQIGFRRSVNQSNVNVNSLADWLEANLLFAEPEVSKSDVVDMLIEDQVCPDDKQDLAHSIASAGWKELERRRQWGGLSEGFRASTTRITEEIDWEQSPIRSLFLLLSLYRILPRWARKNQDFSTQGSLFERVVENICPVLLPGWNSIRTGWSPENATSVPQIVELLRDKIFVQGASNLEDWVPFGTRDGGLDIVCYRQFEDQKEALPAYFLQCASGKNWKDKVQSPSSRQWQKWLDSAAPPVTGIVAPFVIDKKELKMAAVKGQTIVIDRLRLLSAARKAKLKLPAELKKSLIDWMLPRIRSIPNAD